MGTLESDVGRNQQWPTLQKKSEAIHTGDEPGSPTVLRMPSASLIFRVIVEVSIAGRNDLRRV